MYSLQTSLLNAYKCLNYCIYLSLLYNDVLLIGLYLYIRIVLHGVSFNINFYENITKEAL